MEMVTTHRDPVDVQQGNLSREEGKVAGCTGADKGGADDVRQVGRHCDGGSHVVGVRKRTMQQARSK